MRCVRRGGREVALCFPSDPQSSTDRGAQRSSESSPVHAHPASRAHRATLCTRQVLSSSVRPHFVGEGPPSDWRRTDRSGPLNRFPRAATARAHDPGPLDATCPLDLVGHHQRDTSVQSRRPQLQHGCRAAVSDRRASARGQERLQRPPLRLRRPSPRPHPQRRHALSTRARAADDAASAGGEFGRGGRTDAGGVAAARSEWKQSERRSDRSGDTG